MTHAVVRRPESCNRQTTSPMLVLLTPLFAARSRQSVNQTVCQSVNQCPAYSFVYVSHSTSLSISPPVPCLLLCLLHSFVNQSTRQPVNQSTNALLTPLFAALSRQSVNQTACQSVNQCPAYSFFCCTCHVSQSTKQPANQSTNALLTPSFVYVSQSTKQPVNQFINQSVN